MQGVGALGTPNYPAYSSLTVPNGTATANISLYRNIGNATSPVNTETINSGNFSSEVGWSMSSQTATLTVATGSLLNVYSTQVAGGSGYFAVNGGEITAGTAAAPVYERL